MSLESNVSKEHKVKSLFENIGLKVHIAWRTLSKLLDRMPTTARGGEEYRLDLFPEMKTVEDVITHFQGKCIVDIGSGDTYLASDSFINKVASQADPETLYIGIDPAVGRLEWERSNDVGASYAIYTPPGPGKKFTTRGSMPEVPFPPKSVDLFISNYAIGFWVVREKTLLAIFQAMKDFLNDGGEIRLNPVRKQLFEQNNELGQFIKKHFIFKSHGGDPGLLIFRSK